MAIGSLFQPSNGTRFTTLLQTLFYLTGAPVFLENQDFDLITPNYNNFLGRSSGLSINSLDPNPHPDDPLNVKCYGHLGCFRVKYPNLRGFHLFPLPLSDMMPRVCLKINSDRNCQTVEASTVQNLLLGSGKTSYWITHGYIDTGHRPWIQTLVTELLDYDNSTNVFLIDWGKGAEPPYTQAVVNIELLGAYIGHLMTLIEDAHRMRVNETHFIGHSLGAHFGGFVGSWLNDRGYKLGRITGLDPAQPYFQDLNADARLDPSDAIFVDAIHTDAKPLLTGGSLTGLGTQEPSGHADFYPNNGKDQPGCSDGVYQAIVQEKGSIFRGIRRFLGCDHIRSYEFFIESIRSSCPYIGYACESWDNFVNGNCKINCIENPERCNRMGFHAKKKNGNIGIEQYWSSGANTTILVNSPSVLFYSITGRRAPYCREHFRVTLNLGNKLKFRTFLDLNLHILGDKGIVENIKLGARDFRESLSYQYLIAGHDLRGQIEKVILKPTVTNPIWWLVNRMIRNPDLPVISIKLQNLGSGKSFTLCPDGKRFLRVSEESSSVLLSLNACQLNLSHS